MGKEPELEYTANGVAYIRFDVAVERPFKGQDGQREVDWIPCVAWRQQAEFMSKYLGKGRLIAVRGWLQARKWTNQEGQSRKAVEIMCDAVEALDRKKEDRGEPEPAA